MKILRLVKYEVNKFIHQLKRIILSHVPEWLHFTVKKFVAHSFHIANLITLLPLRFIRFPFITLYRFVVFIETSHILLS